MKSEISRSSRRMHTACLNLDSNLRLSQNAAGASLHTARLEQQLRDKVRQMIQMQSQWDAEKVEQNSR